MLRWSGSDRDLPSSAQNPEIWKVSCPHCSVSELAIMRQSKTKPQRLPLFVALQRLEKSADVGKKQTPRNQGENDRVGDHLADDRKTDRHMKSHPDQREPTCPVVAAEHEDSCNESQ